MNKELKRYKLSEITNILVGGDMPEKFSAEKTDFFSVPVYSNGEKNNGLYGYTDAPKVTEPAVTISARGSKVGFAAIRKQPYFPIVRLLSLIPNQDKLDVMFLYYNLKLNRQNGTGSGQPQITIPDISNKTIDIPTIQTQQKIAAVLSALDAKIELNQRINAELESMAKTLYDYWFVQFDFPNEKGKPYKSAGGKMVWNDELKRNVPAGWEVTELRKYITSNRGVSYSGKDIVGSGVPMINLNSFNMRDGSYKPEGIKTYSGDYSENKVLKPFDLVMCNTQQTALDPEKDIIGKSFLIPNIFESDIVSSHHVTTITASKEILKYYLSRLFNTEYFHRYISGYATGTNILGLNFEGVLSFRTAIPSDKLLEQYKSIVLNVEKQKARIITESQTLTELRDWLLPMMMNGQVQVA